MQPGGGGPVVVGVSVPGTMPSSKQLPASSAALTTAITARVRKPRRQLRTVGATPQHAWGAMDWA